MCGIKNNECQKSKRRNGFGSDDHGDQAVVPQPIFLCLKSAVEESPHEREGQDPPYFMVRAVQSETLKIKKDKADAVQIAKKIVGVKSKDEPRHQKRKG